jgi:hypothetical protein
MDKLFTSALSTFRTEIRINQNEVGSVNTVAFAHQRMTPIGMKDHLFNVIPIDQVCPNEEQDPARAGGGFLLGITPQSFGINVKSVKSNQTIFAAPFFYIRHIFVVGMRFRNAKDRARTQETKGLV